MRLAAPLVWCCTLLLAPPAWNQPPQVRLISLDSWLVVWFPFDGDLGDRSGNRHRAASGAHRFVDDRNGTPATAIRLADTAIHMMLIPPTSDFYLSDDHAASLGYWFRHQPESSEESFSVTAGGNSALCRLLTIGISTSGIMVSASVHASECRIRLEHRLEPGADRWHHVACTVNDEYFALFLDGMEVDRRAVYDMKWFVPSPRPMTVNRSGPCLERPWIEMDDLRMYRRVLADTEVRLLFEGRPQGAGSVQGGMGLLK